MTECTQQSLEFHPLGRRDITARFDAPAITSDAGGLLQPKEIEKLLAAHRDSTADHTHLLWSLFVLNCWMNQMSATGSAVASPCNV